MCDISVLPEMKWAKASIPVESEAGDLPFQVSQNYVKWSFKIMVKNGNLELNYFYNRR